MGNDVQKVKCNKLFSTELYLYRSLEHLTLLYWIPSPLVRIYNKTKEIVTTYEHHHGNNG